MDKGALLKSQLREAATVPLRNIPFAATYAHKLLNGRLAAIAEEEGDAVFLDTGSATAQGKSSASSPILKRVRLHDNAIFDLAFSADDSLLFTAAGDRTVKCFDSTDIWHSDGLRSLAQLKGHTASVRSIRPCRNDPCLVATGGRDGHLMLWDLRVGSILDPSVASTSDSSNSIIRPQIVLKNIHMNLQFDRPSSKRRRRAYDPVGGSQHTVTSVQWLRDERLLMTAGAVDGRVKAWDLRSPGDTSEPVVSVSPAENWYKAQGSETWDLVRGRARGLSHLQVNSSGTKILCSCLDSSAYVMDTVSLDATPVRLVGHRGNSFYVQADFSPDEQFVVSGSANHDLHFWNLRAVGPGQAADPLTTLAGHTGEVSVVRWSRQFTQVLSISDDTTCRLWEIGSQSGQD